MCSRAAQFPFPKPATMTASPVRHVLLAVAIAASLLLAPAAAAEAAPKKPAKVTKTTRQATTTTLTIRWKKPKRAKSVAVCVKKKPKAKRCFRYKRSKARAKSVTFRGLKPSPGTDFFYQLRSINGKRQTTTKWRKVNLRVSRGSANQAAGSGSQLVYRWSPSTSARRYELQVSPSSTFSSGVLTASRRGTAARVTGLNGGMTYFARVRGVNGKVKGKWGPVSRTALKAVPVNASVATYNLCGEDKCRTSDSGAWFLRNVPKWATRKPLAGALIRSASPDILVTQESSASKTKFHQALPGYTRGAYKSARQIYFKASRFAELDGGWMTLDSKTKRYATWNLFRDRSTGTAFFVANAHLEPYKGAERDVLRNRQTRRLINRITALNPHRLPVIWGGDWNSNESNANQSKYPGGFDAPKRRFNAIGVVNSIEQTTNLTNAELNSANAGIKAPRANGDQVDAIYVPQSGVAVESWSMLANFVEIDGVREYATPFPSDHNPIVTNLIIATG